MFSPVQHGEDYDIVCSEPAAVHSQGIWTGGDSIFGYTLPVLAVQTILIFVFSRVLYFLLRPLKQPKFVCDILGGIIIGPSVLGRNKAFRNAVFPSKERLVVNTMAQLGAMYFIFLIAVKMDSTLIAKSGRKAVTIGIISLLVPFVAIICAIMALHNYLEGLSKSFLLLLTASVSITAFPVLAYALDELNLLSTSELGQIALSSAMTNDFIGYFFMALAVVLFQHSSAHGLWAFLSLILITTFAVYVIRPALFWIIKRTPDGKPVAEGYIILLLVLALVIGFTVNALGGSVVDGTLMFGLVIPNGPPLGTTLVQRADLMISHFFMPLFFVRIGIETDLYAILNWKRFAGLVSLMVVGYVGKFVGTFLSSLYCKMSLEHALALGVIMNIRGLVEVMVFAHWKGLKFVDDQTFATMVLATIAVAAIVTPLAEALYDPPKRLQKSLNFCQGRSIQNFRHDTEFRILYCIQNEDDVHTMITLLEASNATKESPICAYSLHLVELVGRANPLLLPNDKYKSKTKPNGSDAIASAFSKYSSNTDGRVSSQPFIMVSPYKTMHEGICRLARDRLIPLTIIPFSMNQHSLDGGHGNILRSLNTNVLANATCTVGILVDRGLPSNIGRSKFSYHVGVLFLGGPDDREALAYGIRMSRRLGLRVTLLRFLLMDDHQKDNEGDGQLDDYLVNEFRLTNINNKDAVYHEIAVQDVAEAMSVIGSLEAHYDLVMVGHQWGTDTLLNEEMMDWTGCAELGVVGGVLASSDFGGKMVSVLVMKQIYDPSGDLRRSSKSLGSSSAASDIRPLMTSCWQD